MYYLIIIQNDSSQAVYAHSTLDSALSSFHAELAYRNEARTKTVCTILNSNGELIKNEVYELHVAEAEPEIEEPTE